MDPPSTPRNNYWQLEPYATKSFVLSKKGAFGNKKLPVRELLAWQKGALKNGLLKTAPKESPKIFLRIHNNLIQSYMGDRPHKEKDDCVLAKGVVDFVISDPRADVRDEVYCQLSKQLTQPPPAVNYAKGWELFCICVQYFPPSNDLEPYLTAWLRQHQEHTANVQEYCKFALRKLPKIVAEGARGRSPSLPELKALVSAPFKQAIFGSTLEEVMEIQKAQDATSEIPLVLTVLCQSVLDLSGHQTEGIFRVPGDTAQVTALKIQIEEGNYSCSGLDDPHIPGSLLKLWMRELCNPIIPTDLYDDAIEAAKQEDAKKACALIDRVPPLNQKVVFFVVDYLRKVAQPENVPKTKMSINNLAMVFAPNFLRCPSEDPSVIFNTQKYQQTYVKQLITDLHVDNSLLPASSAVLEKKPKAVKQKQTSSKSEKSGEGKNLSSSQPQHLNTRAGSKDLSSPRSHVASTHPESRSQSS